MAAKYTDRGLNVGLLLGVVLAATGCTTDAERAQQLCTDRRVRIDGLYAAYGGSSVVLAGGEAAAAASSASADASGVLKGLLGAAKDVDRKTFEDDCRRVGSGQATTFWTPKGREFFGRPATRTACAELTALEPRIPELRAKLPPDAPGRCF